MRKFYSLIAFAALSLVSLTANAQFTVPEENEILQSEAYNYRLYKNVDFNAKTINGVAIEGDITFDTSVTTEEFKFNAYSPFRCTTDGLTNLWQSVGNIAWASGYGLRNTGSGPRGLHIASLKKGQILVLQGRNGGYNTAGTNADYNGFCVPNGFRYSSNTNWEWELTDPLIAEDISDEIHAAQDALPDDEVEAGEGEGEEGEGEEPVVKHDNYLYLRIIEDGTLNLPLERSAGILGFQIWIDATADEAVSAPSMKVVGVNGGDRQLEFKPGESTFGNEVTTYYTTDGEDPIYTKDSEEIDHYEYIYLTDGEGNIIYGDDEQPIVLQETPVYKKVIDWDFIKQIGAYGDNVYDGSGSITIRESMDKDGDGIVVVKAASVTSTGMVSEFVTVNVSVGEIVLNAPTLTLQGFDGTARTYAIGWSNNTLCGEEFSFIVDGDNGELYADDMTVGSTFTLQKDVTITVSVPGYTDGVLNYTADYPGVPIKRKASKVEDEEGNPIHDWDFVNLTDEQKAIIKGEVIESYYIKTEAGDSLVCSYDDYIANDGLVVVNGETIDFTNGIANYAPSCWWWDGSRSRATLNVSDDQENTHNRNANNYGYVEDFANVFPNMLIDCAPNTSNNSCIFIYINGDLGAYFMSRPSFTFPRSAVGAGEFLLIYLGTGGSNYTNSRWPVIFEAPTDELLTVSGLPFASGTHIFYMDVYTYADLPTDELEDAENFYNELVSVKEVKASGKAVAAYYSIAGTPLSAPQKGINIVKYADGTSAKVLVK